MQSQNTSTNNISKEFVFKSLVKFRDRFPNRIYLSNKISPEDADVIRKYLGQDTEIAFFEHETPVCSECGLAMSHNGTKS